MLSPKETPIASSEGRSFIMRGVWMQDKRSAGSGQGRGFIVGQ
jgi:hypothetical protein